MTYHKLIAGTFVTLAMGAVLWSKTTAVPSSGRAMTEAATAFLDALDEEQRQRALFDYDDRERLNWHFIPRERKGVALRELHGEALDRAQRLIASGLSDAGYGQALDVMSLEEVLYLLEGGDRARRRERRDPRKYYLSVFGKPTLAGTWGWRLEGHHLSLNYTVVDGEPVATTPEFFGANPARIDAGPGRQVRVLGPEEDIAREILRQCSPEAAKRAWIDRKAPDDVRAAGSTQPPQTPPVGLAYADMSDSQKRLLRELLNEYLKNMPADVERQRRAEIEQAGLDAIHFAWWGSDKPNERHAYRVQGPTFLIEYNNTQNSANHIHSVWRSLKGDFNLPLETSR